MTESQLLTNAVHISWDELKKISRNYKASSVPVDPVKESKPSTIDEPSSITNTMKEAAPYAVTHPVASEPILKDKLTDEVLQLLYPKIKAKINEEFDFLMEVMIKNAESKMRKELHSRLDGIVAQSLLELKNEHKN